MVSARKVVFMKKFTYEEIEQQFESLWHLFYENCALVGSSGVGWMSEVNHTSFIPKRKIALGITLGLLKEWGIGVTVDLSECSLECPYVDEDNVMADDNIEALWSCGSAMSALESAALPALGWEKHSYDVDTLCEELGTCDVSDIEEADLNSILDAKDRAYSLEILNLFEERCEDGLLVTPMTFTGVKKWGRRTLLQWQMSVIRRCLPNCSTRQRKSQNVIRGIGLRMSL